MKAFLLSCVAAVILAILGVVVLNSIQEPADQAFATSAVLFLCKLKPSSPLILRRRKI